MTLTNNEKIRYRRHLLLPEIGEAGQIKLKKARVAVAGAGGLGSPVLLYLAAAGVGTLGIIDHDRVDESNLQRQVLYTTADIGKPKVQIARKRLRELNPGVSVDIWQEKLTKDNAEQILKNYDVAVTATDNFASRFIMNDICVKLGIPLVYGAICRFEGQVSVFNYKGGPTYRCLYAEPEDTVREQDDPELGVIGVLPGIIGCMQANEAIKIITGYGSTLSGKLYVLSISDMEGHTLKIDSTS